MDVPELLVFRQYFSLRLSSLKSSSTSALPAFAWREAFVSALWAMVNSVILASSDALSRRHARL